MTAQIGERLRYEGRETSMSSEPLGDYFALAGIKPGFGFSCTALWRGYVGTWEILEGRLYLVKLNGTLKDGTDASVATFFPGFADRVFAHWYSGKLRVPQGKLLDYVHMGYGSTYEDDLFITLDKGVVMKSIVRHNRNADDGSGPDGAGGHGVKAMTIVPRNEQGKEGKS